jgi:competence protein ComEA
MRQWIACAGLCLALMLAGVGEVLAGRILEYREAHGGFDSVAQLEEVKGIGAKTLADLEDQVVVAD